MKVVINTCFGGFGLSPVAVKRYGEIKGIRLYMYEENDRRLRLISFDEKPPFIPFYFSTPDLTEWPSNDEYYFCEMDIARDDPILIQTVEELKEKANGACAKLSVVEIPDGIEWDISEYDGIETIEETHRSWR